MLQLPLVSAIKPKEWLWRGREGAQPARTQGEASENPPRANHMEWDMGDFGDEGSDNDDENFDLVEAPSLIEEEAVQVDMVMNRVNMQQLKAKMWNIIESLRERSGDKVRFELCFRGVKASLDVSFGVCFVSLLQLAIEHNFHVVNDETDSMIISLNPVNI